MEVLCICVDGLFELLQDVEVAVYSFKYRAVDRGITSLNHESHPNRRSTKAQFFSVQAPGTGHAVQARVLHVYTRLQYLNSIACAYGREQWNR